MVVFDANLSPPTIASIMALAEKHHIPVCADPTSATLALGSALPVTALHDYAQCCRDRGTLYAQSRQAFPGRTSSQIPGQGRRSIAIVTLGELGVCYATSESSGHISAVKTDVVDFTGGGDALTAALIFGILHDFPIDEAVRLGVAAAALTLRCRDTVCPDISLDRIYDCLGV